jgi:hypothetical protein
VRAEPDCLNGLDTFRIATFDRGLPLSAVPAATADALVTL